MLSHLHPHAEPVPFCAWPWSPGAVSAVRLRAIVADAHTSYRDAIVAHLEQELGVHVVATQDRAPSLVDAVRLMRPDVVLIDEELGLDTVRQIAKSAPEVVVIALSLHGEVETQRAFVAAGARACLGKDRAGEALGDLLAEVRELRGN